MPSWCTMEELMRSASSSGTPLAAHGEYHPWEEKPISGFLHLQKKPHALTEHTGRPAPPPVLLPQGPALREVRRVPPSCCRPLRCGAWTASWPS